VTQLDAPPAPPATFLDAEAVLAAALPGYRPRPQQQALAAAVEAHQQANAGFDPELLDEGDCDPPTALMGQAGTGVGKSYAYLLPEILHNVRERRRTVVSVTTRALQDQLAKVDLPTLQARLAEAGVRFGWAMLQGRGRYFCAARAAGAEAGTVPTLARVREHAQAHPDWSGLRDDLPFPVPASEWSAICSEAEECRELGCRDAARNLGDGRCRAEVARSRAESAHVVVVSHALLFTDISITRRAGVGAVLPNYDRVVFDEGHELEDVASETLGARLTEGTFTALVGQLRGWARTYGDDVRGGPHDGAPAEDSLPTRELLVAAHELFEALPAEPVRVRAVDLDKVAAELGAVLDALDALRRAWVALRMDHYDGDYDRAKGRRRSVSEQLNSTEAKLHAVIAEEWQEVVRCIEIEQTRTGPRKVLRTVPISVAPHLRRTVFDRIPCVLVSATLMVGGDPDYLAGRLGVDRYEHLDVGTPFDYPRQARLYVPAGLAEPTYGNTATWENQVADHVVEVVEAAGGGVLVLFPSNKLMRSTHFAVRRRLEGRYTLMVQGEGSVPELAARFKADEDSVLFGTRSFMTGFDVPGRALRVVVVVKMPFPAKGDPLVEARCEAIVAAGGNDFRDYTVPIMSLVFQQAVGRLIRRVDDLGVAVVLDPRLLTKGYGRGIREDLPPMPLVERIEDVADFLAPLLHERLP
jgi:ATP-dependent DNA helicase DinG